MMKNKILSVADNNKSTKMLEVALFLAFSCFLIRFKSFSFLIVFDSNILNRQPTAEYERFVPMSNL